LVRVPEPRRDAFQDHWGAGQLKPGDTMTMQFDQIGEMTVPVR